MEMVQTGKIAKVVKEKLLPILYKGLILGLTLIYFVFKDVDNLH